MDSGDEGGSSTVAVELERIATETALGSGVEGIDSAISSSTLLKTAWERLDWGRLTRIIGWREGRKAGEGLQAKIIIK